MTIDVRLSDEMACAAMIDRASEIGGKFVPIARSPHRWRSAIYTASVEVWRAWLEVCNDNASGYTTDDPAEKRLNAKAAERIAAAIASSERQREAKQ